MRDALKLHSISDRDEDPHMAVHDMSMSVDAETAIQGRALKAIIGAIETWAEQEQERGTDPRLVMGVAPAVALNVIVNILSICHRGRMEYVAEGMLRLVPIFGETMEESATALLYQRGLREGEKPMFEAIKVKQGGDVGKALTLFLDARESVSDIIEALPADRREALEKFLARLEAAGFKRKK